ncbi:alpha/beta fold hydrolase [Polyangium jinanense]|uniref:alpha/beta fold hydrolase n=1 Tax=Polyangium jinanense TaxID=2829994 RepID=UPI0023417261|nr:alpha/beta fold hydrolase [Polyangium jinanense]MDC3960917.1 alpha/beta fold hydrolase [Polyangium jinanense]
MSATSHVSPQLLSLARAIGLVAADGYVDAGWFDNPLDRLRTIVSNAHQRAAFLGLLEEILPSMPVSGFDGDARWYPLLSPTGRGNVYLTIQGELIGVAASLETPAAMTPGARASLRLPLVDVSNGTVVAVAGSAEAPFELVLEAQWAPGSHPSSIAAVASVNIEAGGALRIVLEDLDPAAAPGTRTYLDPTKLDADAARVLAKLITQALAQFSGDDPYVARVLTHLPGLLGLDGSLPALRVHDLLRDPAALRSWLAEIAADPVSLRSWFTRLVGLLGSGLPAAEPTVSGDGSAASPLWAPVLDLGSDSSLSLTLGVDAPASGPPVLLLGVALSLAAAAGRLQGAATLLGLPLAEASPVAVLPAAHLELVTPTTGSVIDVAPAIKLGTVACGIAWEGQRLVPRLELRDVILNGATHPRLDLSNTNALVSSGTAAVQGAIEAALGSSRLGEAVLALVGLRAPASDPSFSHALDIAALLSDPTRAIANVHRSALGDTQHGWEHLFAELAAIFGILTPHAGDGTPQQPWRVVIAEQGVAKIELAAWNARDAATPSGTQLLRLGLRLSFATGPWEGAWVAELLAFDLPPSGSAALRFLDAQHVSLTLTPIPELETAAGLGLTATAISGHLDWVLARTPTWRILVDELVATGSGDPVGPTTLTFPMASFDPAAPDLGLGLGAGTALALLRLLLTEVLHSAGGPAGLTIGALLGLHRKLRGLPADWPLLGPTDPADLGSLFKDPLGAVRAHLEQVLAGSSADGTPFTLAALPWLRALLVSELPARPADTYPPSLPLAGAGTYERPWILPLADGSVELLGWLDPNGPPPAWWQARAERVRLAADGDALVGFLEDVSALLPDVAGALEGRDPAETAAALTALADWFALGDGLVPAAAQAPAVASWGRGTPVPAAHHELPAAPAAIAQIGQAIDGWAGGSKDVVARAVVLLSAPFADHEAFGAYLQVAEPDRPQGAHFDLRAPSIDPLTVPLSHVTATATHYTADLADGDLGFMAAQLARVVARVRELTGQTQVYLVGHSTAGLVARAYGAVVPAEVAGVVTLGTPHGGSPLAPLLDSTMAGAVRLVNVLYPAADRTPAGRAIAHLVAMLDDARPDRLAAFAGLEGAESTGRGLAIPGYLPTGLIEDLAQVVADRALAAAGSLAAPTRFGFGVRARLHLSDGKPGDLDLRAAVRVDALSAALAAASPDPVRPTPAVHVHAEVSRSDGAWLVGGPEAMPGERLRCVELGVSVRPDAGGSATAIPLLRLHDVGSDALRPWLELSDLVNRLPSLPRFASLAGPRPAAGTREALLLDALMALGLVVGDGTGALSFSLEELGAIAAQPTAQLGPRLPALLDVVADAVGATRGAGPTWTRQLASLPIALTVSANPWKLGLRTFDPATEADTLALAPALGVGVAAELTLPDFTSSVDARLSLAATQLRWSSGTVTLAAPPWLEPIQLVPAPPVEVLRDALARHVPMLVASAVISGVLGALVGGDVRVRGIERLLTSPASLFLSPLALGADDGSGLDPAKVSALLQAVASALGLSNAGGIELPGGLVLTASGADPLTLALSGVIPLGAGSDELELELGLKLDRALAVTPTGKGMLRVGLPGSGWAGIEIEVGADPSGLSLSVQPNNAGRIQLLPSFSGFDDLASGVASLLPAVLQAVVDELAPQPDQASGLVRIALSIAKALGIYDFDAQGFEEPTRAAELGKILQPGWLESKATSGAVIADAITQIFTGPTPLVALPGSVTGVGSTVRWTYPLATGGTVSAMLGWTGAGAAAAPALTLGVQGVRLGPVVADELSAGYDQGLVCHLVLRLDAAGELAFLQPSIDFAVDDGRPAFEIHPLGAAAKDEFAVRVAPVPELVLAAGAAMTLLERWGVPLVAQLLLRTFEAELPRSLWAGGPTVRAVLDASGLVEPNTTPPALAAVRPALPELALRALKALVTNVTIPVSDTLSLTPVAEQGRRGLRLKGRQELSGGDVDVSVRFGEAKWLDDADAGVTLWLLEDTEGMPPVRITPALDVTGLGVVLSGAGDEALVKGPFEIGAAGGFLFFRMTFLDAARAFAVDVSELGASAELDAARISVSSEDGDSFLKKVLPPELAAPFALGVAWREGKGLILHGGSPGGGLELTFPLNLDLAILQLQELYLALKAREGVVSLEAALSGNASLGPFHASVQRVGLKASFGAAGNQLGFRAPDGVGLAMDAGIVGGGGFLFVDESKGQYAGVVQLEFKGIALKAIGIITTRLPDGRDGYSLLLIISAEFTPIQLGFGFTLSGVGGLIGVNRTAVVDVLRAGIKARTLDSIMFPRDPVANAPQLISNLSAVFPPAEGRFVIGPMARLGWGTPTLVTLDLGLILELPAPVRLIVLGRLRMALPHEEVPIVAINMDVLGVVDFERSQASVDATLYDSTIAGFALTGDMAMRMSWGDRPGFALAAGGFHPRFQPPPGFPALDRLALSLCTGNNPRLRLESYLALTSNTAQFGARLELYASKASFSIEGVLAFDALFQFEPFSVLVEMSGSVALKQGSRKLMSVSVYVTLTGPSPWHARGYARFKLLFISADVSFDVRLGSAAPQPAPALVELEPLVEAALKDPRSWSTQLPPEGESLVSVREIPRAEGELLIHPLATLSVTQRVAPLGRELQRFGSSRIAGATRLDITQLRVGGTDLVGEPIDEYFAPAQFLDLSDHEKLARSSFERWEGGRRVGGRGVSRDSAPPLETTLEPETIIIDKPDGPARLAAEAAPMFARSQVAAKSATSRAAPSAMTTLQRFAASGAAAHAKARSTGTARFRGPALKLGVAG